MLSRECLKRTYTTYNHAQKAIYNIKHQGRNQALDTPDRIYLCHHCGNWHITSQEQIVKGSYKRKAAIRKRDKKLNQISWRY